MPNIGPVELIIILVIALIVIGPGRLPDVGAALGKSIREFRKASTDVADATRLDANPTAPSNPNPNPTPASVVPPVAAPAPTPQPPVPSPTASTIPAPVATPAPPPSDDEPTHLPA
jgi:sec-independent protein translocase protein TatA